MQSNPISMTMCLGLGTALGVSLGVTLGVVIGNIGLGVAMGPGLGACVGLVVYFVLEASRPKPFSCPGCGYSSAGLPRSSSGRTTCPECGSPFDPDEVNTPEEPHPEDRL